MLKAELIWRVIDIVLFIAAGGITLREFRRRGWLIGSLALFVCSALLFFSYKSIYLELFPTSSPTATIASPAAPPISSPAQVQSPALPAIPNYGAKLSIVTPPPRVDKLATPRGLLSIKSQSGMGLGKALFLNDVKLLEDFLVTITGVSPNLQSPELVLISSFMGGRVYPPTSAILDLKADKPHVINLPIDSGEVTVWRKSDGVYTFIGPSAQPDEKDTLGDPVQVVILYTRARKLAIRQSFDPTIDYGQYVGRYPDMLLADTKARKPFLDVLSSDFRDFRDFRATFSEASGLTLASARFLIGDGQNNFGEDGVFALDVATGRVWPFWTNGKMTGKPTLRYAAHMSHPPSDGGEDSLIEIPEGSVVNILNRWLTREGQKFDWSKLK